MATWEGFSDQELRRLKKDKKSPQVRQSARFSNDRPVKKTVVPRTAVPRPSSDTQDKTHETSSKNIVLLNAAKDGIATEVMHKGTAGATNEPFTNTGSKSSNVQPTLMLKESQESSVKELEIATDM